MKTPPPVLIRTADGRLVAAVSCAFGWVTATQEYIHRSKGKLVRRLNANENVHSNPR